MQRPNHFFADEFLDFGNLKLPARHDLPERKIAFLALKLFVVLVNLAAAFRTRHIEFAIIARNGVAVVSLGFGHNFSRRVGNFLHEVFALQFTARHEAQLEFPVPCQFRRDKLRDIEPAQQRDERKRFGRWLQLAPISMHIFFPDQTLDDLRAGRRRTEPLLDHRLAQFLVLNQFARAFHCAEQRRFRVARWRLRLVCLHVDFLRRHRFVRLHGHKRRGVIRLCLLAIDCQPAGVHHHLAFALERLALDTRDARGYQKFRRRIKNRKEAFRHQVVEFLFRLAQMLRRERSWNDREVIGNFRVIEDALVWTHPAAF